MAPLTRVIVKGQRELDASFRRYESRVRYGLAKDLLTAAGVVAVDARNRFSSIDQRSAAGFRPRVRSRRGGAVVVVEQRLRRTTGQHPQYGSLQMGIALLPALKDNEANVVAAIDYLLSKASLEEGF